MPDENAALGIVQRIALREITQHADQCADNKGKVGERGRVRREFAVEMTAERFELGDIELLDVREMRNIPLRLAHALRNHAPYADDLDLLGRRLVGRTMLGRP